MNVQGKYRTHQAAGRLSRSRLDRERGISILARPKEGHRGVVVDGIEKVFGEQAEEWVKRHGLVGEQIASGLSEAVLCRDKEVGTKLPKSCSLRRPDRAEFSALTTR